MTVDLPFTDTPTRTAIMGRQPHCRFDLLTRLRSGELVVMARYMQILSDRFVTAHPNRIINIHHSVLPASSAPTRTGRQTTVASS
jgi:formyltetrahydrofolate deformylase